MIFTWLTRTSQIQAFKPVNIFRPVTINENQFLMALTIELNILVFMFTAVDIINKNISRFSTWFLLTEVFWAVINIKSTFDIVWRMHVVCNTDV